MTALIAKTELGFGVSGVIDFDNVVAISRQGSAHIENLGANIKKIEVNLEEMQEQNAAALTLLLTWLRAAKKQDVSLIFIGISDSLSRMAAAFGLTDLLQSKTQKS